MSQKFIVEGGLEIPTGEKMSLFGGTDNVTAISTDISNNGSTTLATESTVKTYVDNQLGDSSLTLETTTTDHGYNKVIDLDDETLYILGTTNEIETTMSADNSIKIGLPSTVSGLTEVSATTLTDGTASLSNGAISALTTIGSSGVATLDSGGNGSSFGGALTIAGAFTYGAVSTDCSGAISVFSTI